MVLLQESLKVLARRLKGDVVVVKAIGTKQTVGVFIHKIDLHLQKRNLLLVNNLSLTNGIETL
jgi:hypothetical protein